MAKQKRSPMSSVLGWALVKPSQQLVLWRDMPMTYRTRKACRTACLPASASSASG
jgi:hypothetical protein